MKRCTTGISALDLVLDGGFPAGSLVVLAGGPGTGKTILAQQICFANATPEHPAIFYTTFAEPHVKLVRYLEQLGFFDAAALEERVEFVNLESLLFEQGDGDDALGPALNEVVRACFERQPSVVVLDSAKALRDFAAEGAGRRIFYELVGRVAHTDSLLLFLGEYSGDDLEGSPEFSLADGIVQLAYDPAEPVDRRWLRVTKLRGSNHLGGKHTLEIDGSGVRVYPRLESLRPGQPAIENGRISSGILALDEMMGGGIPAGDLTALLGPSGSGKTIAALRFVAEGLEHGEHGLYVSFQENVDQLVKKAAGFGWDLATAREDGRLRFYHLPQGIFSLDILGAALRDGLAEGGVRRVAVDSLAELVFSARESARFPAYARQLAAFLRAAGATGVITSETATLGPMADALGGLSFLFHNVVLLRYIEQDSELRRAVTVLKMRDSDHEKGLRQFVIDDRGLTIGDQLEGLTGVLGWSALRGGPPPRN